MICLHPNCAVSCGASWEANITSEQIKVKEREIPPILDWLNSLPALGQGTVDPPGKAVMTKAAFKRLMSVVPCLYAVVKTRISAKGVVHLTELTMRQKVDSQNVYWAFKIQYPSKFGMDFVHPPALAAEGPGVGDITEALCSELLSNHGVPKMAVGNDDYPRWSSKTHLSLNDGKMNPLKLYGDLLIPAAPHNILISVKTEAARERLVVSGNRLESVGFGFFNEPKEFWTASRINLYKRWGFISIYMPRETLNEIERKLTADNRIHENTNINGKSLLRPLEDFGSDMQRIAGRLTIDL